MRRQIRFRRREGGVSTPALSEQERCSALAPEEPPRNEQKSYAVPQLLKAGIQWLFEVSRSLSVPDPLFSSCCLALRIHAPSDRDEPAPRRSSSAEGPVYR